VESKPEERKSFCIVGTGPENIVAEARFDTTTPEETIAQVIDFLKQQRQRGGQLAAIGIGSFGPLDLNPDSSTFGTITTTPKSEWAQFDFLRTIKENLEVPVAIDTDVNAAALGEKRWGAAKGLDTFIYLTVGTGIGGGGMMNGELMHGLLHPEMGHVLCRTIPKRILFTGYAHITAIVWRVWPRARQSRRDGVKRAMPWAMNTRHGDWKQSI
jgi:fructokinase